MKIKLKQKPLSCFYWVTWLFKPLLISAFIFLFHGLNAQTTKSVYFIGNSVTDAINYAGMVKMAQAKGYTQNWGREMIPGSPLVGLWDGRATAGFSEQPYGLPANAFPNYIWDCISLQPFDRGIDGSDGDLAMSRNFIDLAKSKSPNVQFYIYGRWPRCSEPNNNPAGHLSDPQCTPEEWNRRWNRTFPGSEFNSEESRMFFEKLTDAINASNPGVKKILMVPVGEVFASLNNKMAQGLVPGYPSIWKVYADNIHIDNVGSFIATCTFLSTFYATDPRGLQVPSEFGAIDANLVSIIESTIWEVVSTYSYTGVSSANTVRPSSVSVSPATLSVSRGQSSTISSNVLPTNATNRNVIWSSDNTSVATVSATGVVTGVAIGSCTITATTIDGGLNANCVVTVVTDNTSGSVYLSDMAWTSATASYGTVHNDKSVDGNPMKINGVSYSKGLGTHAVSEIVYNLGGQYTGFKSDVGMDDESGLTGCGSATFQVWTDGTMIYESAKILRGQSAQTINVDVRGKNTLKLTVTDGGDGNCGDHVDWGNAQLQGSGTSVPVTGITVSPTSLSLKAGKTSTVSATIAPQSGCKLEFIQYNRCNG